MTTVVYYTAHLELPHFEQRVRERLSWASGELPIVSVSQQPLNFGQNIVVGEHEPCMWNMRRQMLIGVQAAPTDTVAFCEADTLYPPEFFKLTADNPERFTRYSPGAIVYMSTHRAWPKHAFETGIVIRRELALELLTANLFGPEWSTAEKQPAYVFDKDRADIVIGEWPIVSFKTGRGLHKFSHSRKRDRVQDLPGWGNVKQLKRELFQEIAA